MDLKHIVSKLENGSEEDAETLLQQFNQEVSRGSAPFYLRPNSRCC